MATYRNRLSIRAFLIGDRFEQLYDFPSEAMVAKFG
jgi:hypothetical protein